MRPKIALLARTAALVALAFAAGCDSTPARQPRHTLTVVLSPGTVTPPVEIGLVSAVKVVLPGPDASSGLVWEIASNNTTVLEQMAPLATDPGSAGAGPTTSASFYSLRPGKSILRFFLVRPSETEAIPAGKCEVTVRVSE
jgi:hypothetical protein